MYYKQDDDKQYVHLKDINLLGSNLFSTTDFRRY